MTQVTLKAPAGVGSVSTPYDSGAVAADGSISVDARSVPGLLEAGFTFANGFAGLQNWSIIGNRSMPSKTLVTTAGGTSRGEVVSPYHCEAVMLVFAGTYSATYGEIPMPDHVYVEAAWQETDFPLNLLGSSATSINDSTSLPRTPFTFGGKETGLLAPGRLLFSDPLRVHCRKLKRNFFLVHNEGIPYAPPAAPAAVASAGAGIAAGTYAVAISVVYPDGSETPGSTAASVATSGSNLQITITDPGASSYPGAKGYRAWISQAGQTSPLYWTGKPVQPFGSNLVLSGLPPFTIAQSLRRKNNGAVANRTTGWVSNGATIQGCSDNGEYVATSIKATEVGFVGSANISGAGFGPNVILGYDPSGVHPSLAILGDSIMAGVGNEGFENAFGPGWAGLASRGQFGYFYNPATPPVIGHANFGCAAETMLTYCTQNGNLRRQMALLATKVLNEYGTNDLGNGTGVAPLVGQVIADAYFYTSCGRTYYKSTLTPRAKSTDGWKTLANQSMPVTGVSIDYPGGMFQFNNWLLAGGSAQVSGEAMFGSYATPTPSTNFYGGGDGAAVNFQTSLPFLQGSEAITVAGAAQQVLTNYGYLYPATITLPNGTVLNVASGVTFNAAPASGSAVVASYIAMDGYKTICGALANVVDLRSVVSINNAGQPNGVWWALANGTVYATGAATGTNSSTSLTGTFASQDSYRGMAVRITSDSANAAAVGLVQTVGKNTTTAITVSGWTSTPSSSATYEFIDGTTIDGTHPTGQMSAKIAQSASVQAMIAS